MSDHKYTNVFCLLITALMILVTAVFMNGETLGLITPINTDASADTDGTFSTRDLDAGFDSESATYISLDKLDGFNSEGAYELDGNLYIVSKGIYVLTGTMAENQRIIVSASGCKPQIVLDGVTIENRDRAPIYIEKADKVFITLAENSENIISLTASLCDEDTADDINAAIFSKCDLSFNGSGSLSITANEYNGIRTSEDCVITAGTYTINAGENGIIGRDSLRIAGGTFVLTTGKDGLKANNDSEKEDKGYIIITDGDFTIRSEGDGIQAETDLTIEGGSFDIISGGGSTGTTSAGNDFMKGDFRGGRGFGKQQADSSAGETDSGKAASTLDAPDAESSEGTISDDMTPPDGNSIPEDITPPDSTSMPEDMTPPDGASMPEDMTNQNTAALQDNEGNPSEGETPSDPQTSSDASLTATAQTDSVSSKGIKAGGALSISAGTFTLDCLDDAIHSNKNVTIADGSFQIASDNDAIHADNSVTLDGGTITITFSYEGIEGAVITVNDGDISLKSADDGFNASSGSSSAFDMFGGFGQRRITQTNDVSADATSANDDTASANDDTTSANDDTTSANDDTASGNDDTASDPVYSDEAGNTYKLPTLIINGGTVYVDAGGDGLDSNGDLIINGGNIYVNGPTDSGNGALDSGSESGGDCVVNGGTILAAGAAGMAECFTSSSSQPFLYYTTDAFADGDDISIKDPDGNVIFTYSLIKSGNSLIFSSPDLTDGTEYTLTIGSYTCTATASTADVATSGFGNFGGKNFDRSSFGATNES